MPNAPGYHPFAELVGLSFVSTGEGRSECRLAARTDLENPQKVLHGALIYALADTGMGGALYSLLSPGEWCATSQISISYFAPVPTGEIVCRTRVLHKGKRTASLESEIVQAEKLVAKAMGTFAIFEKK